MRERDEAAFTAYVRARQSHLVWVAEILAPGGRHEAEDLVQTALVRLAAHWHRVDDPDAWLRRVLANLVVDRVRRRARQPVAAITPEALDPADPRRFEDLVDDRDRLFQALAELPVAQRKAVVMRYLAGLTEQDTARELDVSVGAVKSATSRGLGRLRTIMSQEER